MEIVIVQSMCEEIGESEVLFVGERRAPVGEGVVESESTSWTRCCGVGEHQLDKMLWEEIDVESENTVKWCMKMGRHHPRGGKKCSWTGAIQLSNGNRRQATIIYSRPKVRVKKASNLIKFNTKHQSSKV